MNEKLLARLNELRSVKTLGPAGVIVNFTEQIEILKKLLADGETTIDHGMGIQEQMEETQIILDELLRLQRL